MSITFQLTASIPVELRNPSYAARALVKVLKTPKYSRDDLRSWFTVFFNNDLATSLHGTEPYDPRIVFLATKALQKFIYPAKTLDRIFVLRLELFLPVVVPVMIRALQSYTEPEIQDCRPEDAIVLSTLATLLEHEEVVAQFAQTESSMLAAQIRNIVMMWIQVSGSTSETNTFSTDLVKIIHILRVHRTTRRALIEVVNTTERPLFRGGLTRLVAAVGELDNPSFSGLPSSLLANMRGLSTICQLRPELRNDLFEHGLIKALCSLLAYAVIDQPRTVAPGERQKFNASLFVIEISYELAHFFYDATDSSAFLEALDGRLLESIQACLHHTHFRSCGMMRFLLEDIREWSMKSGSVAHKVAGRLDEFRSSAESWAGLPQLPSRDVLTIEWHGFVAHFESGRLDTACMKP
ncbi:hypothetical protein BDZ89DRAFT_1144221 [Hymenopellis radicata]|nr:hypothetical protein BDZ89DRAFT_1144221 [Hymenopellis radicata]